VGGRAPGTSAPGVQEFGLDRPPRGRLRSSRQDLNLPHQVRSRPTLSSGSLFLLLPRRCPGGSLGEKAMPSCIHKLLNLLGFTWCPGPELNQ
jgi:hypothetical protein